MNTLTKKLVLSVLTLILTVGAFAATTFAWFTLGNTAQVGTISGQVATGDGLQVSLGNTGVWTSFISEADIIAYLAGAEKPAFTKFTPITSTDGESFTKIVNANQTLTSAAALSSEYLTLTLKFRSESAGTVQLSGASLSSSALTWTNEGLVFNDASGAAVAAAGTVDEFVSNGARISLVGTETVVLEQTEGTNDNLPGKGLITSGAHSFFLATFGAAQPLGLDYTSKFGSVNALIAPNTIEVGDISDEDLLILTDDVSTSGYYIGSVTVNIWLEGWDVNTYNPLFNSILNVTLDFKKVA